MSVWLAETNITDWDRVLIDPHEGERFRKWDREVVHSYRSYTGLCGMVSACGCVWGTFEVVMTEDQVSCKSCLRRT